MRLEHLAHEFYEWMRSANFSRVTIQGYRYNLKRFLKYLGDERIETLDQITPKIIYEYQTHLYYQKSKFGGNLSIYMQHSVLSTVQAFCRFLVKTDKLTFDPSSGITFPKKPRELPEVMTLEEIANVLSQPDVTTIMGFRDRTILEVLYATGMRSSELRSLQIYDVNLEDEELRIKEGKGNKERIVPLGQTASEYTREYLQTIRPRLTKNESNLLFLSKHGKKIGQWDLLEIVKKSVKKAGIEKAINVHTFRHTCATHLLQGGADIRYIQKLLGHESIISTQLYTKVEVSDLKAVHERCHPREKLE